MGVGLLLLKKGKTDSGRVILKNALQYHHWAGDLSRINAASGDKQKAIEYLRELMKEGFRETYWIKADPYWDEIRDQPEFRKLINELENKNDEDFRRIKENQGKSFVLDF